MRGKGMKEPRGVYRIDLQTLRAINAKITTFWCSRGLRIFESYYPNGILTDELKDSSEAMNEWAEDFSGHMHDFWGYLIVRYAEAIGMPEEDHNILYFSAIDPASSQKAMDEVLCFAEEKFPDEVPK
jgi:hypothetical protein